MSLVLSGTLPITRKSLKTHVHGDIYIPLKTFTFLDQMVGEEYLFKPSSYEVETRASGQLL